jgi:hypothetical protein
MITKQDAANLIDALEEWHSIVQPKELDAEEIGLNDERYQLILKKLEAIVYGELSTII